jgi:sugar-specific transcriptional regulator TrmB
MDIYKELGLTIYEKKVYEAILKLGRTNATNISEMSKVPQTAVYPSLKNLQNKGLVQKFSAEISEFEAINPKISITKLINSKQKNLEEMKIKAIDDLNKITKDQIPIKKKVIELGSGRNFSNETYHEYINKAEKSLFILGWKFEKVGEKYDILKRLKIPLKRKVDVRIISIGEKENKNTKIIKEFMETGIKIKFLPFEDFSLLIADNKLCKITIKQKGEDKVSLNILDENFVDFIRGYYLELWNKAENFEI